MALNYFSWYCNNKDPYRGMFNPDFEGACFARSKRLFTTMDAAEAAARAHSRRCALKHLGLGCTIEGKQRKTNRRTQRMYVIK